MTILDMEIVNGYACLNCADAEVAKRGIDPAKGLAATRDEQAQKTLQSAPPQGAAGYAGVDPVLAEGPRGRQVNVTA